MIFIRILIGIMATLTTTIQYRWVVRILTKIIIPIITIMTKKMIITFMVMMIEKIIMTIRRQCQRK